MSKEPAQQQRTLILHGGMHKTGSSAIQKYLFERLDAPDVEYFCFDGPNSSQGLLNVAELQDLETQLRIHFSSIKLVLYIRPLYSRIESAFQQKLKHRLIASSMCRTIVMAGCSNARE